MFQLTHKKFWNWLQGSYVAFLDDDDICISRKLELQLSAMKETI